MRAAITPGTQPQPVRRSVIRTDPHPLSITAKGGKKIAKITLQNDISYKINWLLPHVIPSWKHYRSLFCSLYSFRAQIVFIDNDAEHVFVEPFVGESKVTALA